MLKMRMISVINHPNKIIRNGSFLDATTSLYSESFLRQSLHILGPPRYHHTCSMASHPNVLWTIDKWRFVYLSPQPPSLVSVCDNSYECSLENCQNKHLKKKQTLHVTNKPLLCRQKKKR